MNGPSGAAAAGEMRIALHRHVLKRSVALWGERHGGPLSVAGFIANQRAPAFRTQPAAGRWGSANPIGSHLSRLGTGRRLASQGRRVLDGLHSNRG